MVAIYVDGDACPVKEEVLKVAVRNAVPVHLVANSWHRNANHPLVNQVIVPEEPDAADDWIADHAGGGDIIVTADILLAARGLEAGATVLGPDGRAFTPDSIGMKVAMRDLMSELRDQGEVRGGNSGFTKQDRSRFLNALETAVRKAPKADGENNVRNVE